MRRTVRHKYVSVRRDPVGDLPRLLSVPRDLEGAAAPPVGRLPGGAVDLVALQRHGRVLQVGAFGQQGFGL